MSLIEDFEDYQENSNFLNIFKVKLLKTQLKF